MRSNSARVSCVPGRIRLQAGHNRVAGWTHRVCRLDTLGCRLQYSAELRTGDARVHARHEENLGAVDVAHLLRGRVSQG